MPATKVKPIDIKNINTFKKVLHELRALEKTLPGSQLSVLAPFNGAYVVITTAIERTAKNGNFENPNFIEKFTACFSGYYFQVINDALSGEISIPVAWANLLSEKPGKQWPNFIRLLMGASAHINHDLSLVMHKMLDNDDPDNLLGDVIKVDQLLIACDYDILNTFTESKKIPRFIKNKSSFIYVPVVMRIILYWRLKALKDYLAIKQSGVTPDRAWIKGKAISIRLMQLGRFLGQGH